MTRGINRDGNIDNAKTLVIDNKRVREEVDIAQETKTVDTNEINKLINERNNKVNDENTTKNQDINIEDEIEKSIKKMVARETLVARAYIDGDEEIVSPNINDVIDDIKDKDEATKEDIYVTSGKNTKKKMDKKTLYTIIAISVAVVALIVVMIVVAVTSNKSVKSGYSYNEKTGMNLYDQGKYVDAIDYLKKASLTSQGKKDLELKMALYQCYYKTKDYDSAIETLKDILTYDSDYKDAIKALAKLYYDENMGEELTQLINTYKDTSSEKYIEEYMVNAPVPDKSAGSYNEDIEVTFTEEDNIVIYYTLDGTKPTTQSTVYEDPIKLNNGTTKIRAIAVNNVGVYSDEFEGEYVLVYTKPSAPNISPASGTYTQGQVFAITNIPEGAKAYYTLDGTTPTSQSQEYVDEVVLPVGNIIVSAIIVGDHDQISQVTKRNYIITATVTYTRQESQTLLQEKLKSNGVMLNNTTLANNNKAEISYVSTSMIDQMSMYVFQLKDKTSNKVVGTYGVGINSGTCYILTESNGTYISNAL